MDVHHVLLGTKTECKFTSAFFNIYNCRHIIYLAVCSFFGLGSSPASTTVQTLSCPYLSQNGDKLGKLPALTSNIPGSHYSVSLSGRD